MDMLKNPIIGRGFGALLILIIIIIDQKSNKINRKNKDYTRLFFFIFVVLTGMLHFIYNDSTNVMKGGSDQTSMISGRPDF